jgi:hypothetical protein
VTVDGPEQDPVQRLLLTQAQAISQLRAELDELTSEFTDSTAALLQRVDDLEAGSPSGGAPRAWCWRGLGPHAEAELWSQLHDWVPWLRERYPLAKRLPPCWHEHPELVEEITALWLAWQAAYQARNASLTAPADWHDRWLPGFLHRLEHGPFAIDCFPAHQSRPEHLYDRGAVDARA